MKIVIIEDEEFAARRLENMIGQYDPSIVVAAKLESVSESVAWFKANEEPDLIFLDIHLEDDLSFAIFKEVPICCSIVFTTATDELAARAFHLKGIDYLLKPIIQTDLYKMLDKYKDLPKSLCPVNPDIFNEIFNPVKL
jgi:two-component system response regulator LytT